MSALREGSLFAGYGGLSLGTELALGTRTAWVSEIDESARRILAVRYPDAPNHGDITAIDWDDVEPVDVVTGGFPCQDLSLAGRRAGLRPGTRSGLWDHMARAIDALRPRLVIAENVRGLLSAPAHSDVEPCPWCLGDPGSDDHLRALGAVLGDLADIGYDATWIGLRAADVGAPHGRFRVFIVAQDANRAARDQRRLPAPGQAPRGRTRAHAGRRGRAPAADPDREPVRITEVARTRSGAQARPERACPAARTDWGPYEPAISRWERVTGRPAPRPADPSPRGSRLSPRFVEWLMGLPDGWVTDVPGLTRVQQLGSLGNGVVPLQAATAITRALQTTTTTWGDTAPQDETLWEDET